MDGLDLQTARGLQGAGEQGARERQVGRALVDGCQLGMERGVVHHRPVAQALEQPVLHLGGGGLGEGDAKDRLGTSPPQQQAGDAVDQGAGLARPRVGGDEGREGRLGGEDLGIGAHASPSPASPMTCHSHTRARWS